MEPCGTPLVMVAPPPGTTLTTNSLLSRDLLVVRLTMVHSRVLLVNVFASQSECRMRVDVNVKTTRNRLWAFLVAALTALLRSPCSVGYCDVVVHFLVVIVSWINCSVSVLLTQFPCCERGSPRITTARSCRDLISLLRILRMLSVSEDVSFIWCFFCRISLFSYRFI